MISALWLIGLRAPWTGDNRLSFVELALQGACEVVVLDCGAEGLTRVLGPFSSAEDRRLTVPVPVRAPEDAEARAALPLPRPLVLPEGARATVRVLGWGRRAGPPPARAPELPARSTPARPRPPELVLAAVALPLFAFLRRRLAWCLAAAVGLALLVLLSARSRTAEHPVTRLLQWDAGEALGELWTAGEEELALAEEGLSVVPAGRSIEIELSALTGRGRARSDGARLVGWEGRPAPSLARERNGGESLQEVWTRSPGGGWRAHGPWPEQRALAAPLPAGGDDPPSWLVTGLPPGSGVLVARSTSGLWLRCLGFERD